MRRVSFGPALRSWRTRRGLSQERLAVSAGTVARHVSRLETGRAHPSAAMVRALARALAVPPDALGHLLVAAGHAPQPVAVHPAAGPVLLAAVQRLLDAHEPYPALALDPDWVVVAHNAAAGRILAVLDPAALEGRHALRVALHPGGLVRYATDDAPWADALRARAADQAARSPDGPLARVLAEVGGAAHVPPDVAVPLRLRLPCGEVTLLAAASRFAVPGDLAAAGLTIDTLLPADPASQAALEHAAHLAAPRADGTVRRTRA